jgi:hypothetical protein
MKNPPPTKIPKLPAPAVVEESKRVTSPGGAVREAGVAGSKTSRFPARFDLISTVGLRRLAETYGEGAEKYSDNSYLKGFPADDLLNHVLAHLNTYRARISARGVPLTFRKKSRRQRMILLMQPGGCLASCTLRRPVLI